MSLFTSAMRPFGYDAGDKSGKREVKRETQEMRHLLKLEPYVSPAES